MTHFADDIAPVTRARVTARLSRWLPAAALPEARVRVLSGGAINKNLLIEADDSYVLRLAPPAESRTEIGIDMANSTAVATIAGQAGVGPVVHGIDEATGDSLIQFHQGVLNASTIRNDDVLRRVGDTVRRLHDLPVSDIRRVSAFDEIEDWTGNAESRGPVLAEGKDRMWDLLEQCRAALGQVAGECLSHRDLNPQNCIDDGDRVRLIDWDFSGVDSPYLDMAMLATYSDLDDRELDVFLAAAIDDYQPADLARVQLTRFVHALREWAWCLSASESLEGQADPETSLLPTEAILETNFYDGYREINWRFAHRLAADPRWDEWMATASLPVGAPGSRTATGALRGVTA